MKRRLLALLLTFLMLVSAFPMTLITAFAEEASSRSEQIDTLYENDFDTAMNLNEGGTSSNAALVDDATNCTDDGKGIKINGEGIWKEPVALNGTDGAVTIEVFFYNNNFNGKVLSINGVEILAGNASTGGPIVGGVDSGASGKKWRTGTLTVTIADLDTGIANIKWVDVYGNTYTGSVELGCVENSLELTLAVERVHFRNLYAEKLFDCQLDFRFIRIFFYVERIFFRRDPVVALFGKDGL